MINLEQVRRDTPGCKTKAHFNNAGSSLMAQPVIDAINHYMTLEIANGGYETEAMMDKELKAFYAAAAALVKGQSRNMAFTSSATNSFAKALSAVPLCEGDVVIIAEDDYSSNQIFFLSLQQRMGIRLVRAASLPEGGVDVADVERLVLQHRPKLISLTHVPSHTGLVQPVAEVGRICRREDILYLVDACQSVGQLPLDVAEIGCDFLCATMRKFLRGPRGTGFLYVSDAVLERQLSPLFIDMHGATWSSQNVFEPNAQATRFEDWEQPYALMLGTKVALEYANSLDMKAVAAYNHQLCEQVRAGIREIDGMHLLDKGKELSSIITVAIPGKAGNAVVDHLRSLDINTSVSTRKGGAVIDFEHKRVDWALRISPHYYNTAEEVTRLIDALRTL